MFGIKNIKCFKNVLLRITFEQQSQLLTANKSVLRSPKRELKYLQIVYFAHEFAGIKAQTH